MGFPEYRYSMVEKCFAFFEQIWYPFECPGVSLEKNCHPFEQRGLSVPKKCHPFEWLGLSVWKKLSSLRTAWDIRFKKLLSVRTARAIRLKKKLLTIGGTEPICSKILAKFPSQNHFISTHSCRTICYSPGLVCYEVCLQTYHEYLWISAPL